MKVEFRAKRIFDGFPVEAQIRTYYEIVIECFVNEVCHSVGVSKLAAVIIPENFALEVMAFQESLGKHTPLTNNEHGEAVGKMVYDRKQDTYSLFLAGHIAQYVMSDTVLTAFFGRESENIFLMRRQFALNMLAHEIAHISVHKQIWGEEERQRSFLECFSIILFDEYCACRISNSIVEDSLNVSNQKTICELEKKIECERDRFVKQQITLSQFVDNLIQYAELILKYAVSYIGAQHGRENREIEYTEGYITKVAPIFCRRLQMLFVSMQEEKQADLQCISELIVMYLETMRIELIENDGRLGLRIQ